ncbi:MAG: hypothetical protein HYW63_00330 [Candidatus Levybacteria bacterium]|nr:hypothetical protein [Candidatus Levybacteria bacterium]
MYKEKEYVFFEQHGIKSPEGNKQLIIVRYLDDEEVDKMDDLDESTPLYTFGELMMVADDGKIERGIIQISQALGRQPTIDFIMNPRRPHEDLIGLYSAPDEGLSIELLEAPEDPSGIEVDVFVAPAQNPQRPN